MANLKELPKKSNDRQFGTYLIYSGIAIAMVVVVIWIIAQFFGLTASHHQAMHDIVYPQLAMWLSTLNIILLGYLLAKYLEVYFEAKSEFTLGLIALVAAMIAHSITSNPLFYFNLGFGAMSGPFAFIPSIFTLAASLILIYLVKQ